MQRWLLIALVAILIFIVWVILVAPDYDLDDGTISGKQFLSAFWLLLLLCAAGMALLPTLQGDALRWESAEPPRGCDLPLIVLLSTRLC